MFYIGDIPAVPLVVDLPDDGHTWTGATATMTRPDGTTAAAASTTLDLPSLEVEVIPPGPLTLAGVHSVAVTLTDAGAGTSRLPRLRFVVEDEASGWHTIASASEEWADAENIAEPVLFELLDIARGDVLAYASVPAEDEAVPVRYRKGQIMQARNTWNAARVDPATGGDGEESFIIRPFPLDWAIRQVLRPRTGIPVIG